MGIRACVGYELAGLCVRFAPTIKWPLQTNKMDLFLKHVGRIIIYLFIY